jgi:hypothetical protein
VASMSVTRYAVHHKTIIVTTGARVKRIFDSHPSGCFYVNPQYTVSCITATPEFFRATANCKKQWRRYVTRTLKQSTRSAILQDAGPLRRQLVVTGILIIDGVLVESCYWKRVEYRSVVHQLIQDMTAKHKSVYRQGRWCSRHIAQLSVAPDGSLRWKGNVHVLVDPRYLPSIIEAITRRKPSSDEVTSARQSAEAVKHSDQCPSSCAQVTVGHRPA